jgi:hypothetical protein
MSPAQPKAVLADVGAGAWPRNCRYPELPDADHASLYIKSHRVAPFARDFLTEVSARLALAAV